MASQFININYTMLELFAATDLSVTIGSSIASLFRVLYSIVTVTWMGISRSRSLHKRRSMVVSVQDLCVTVALYKIIVGDP